ncbi:HAD family hydrolase [Candidatus Woesearchaeota archaeon]|nr:HAD family hydrolase [Candidatus Woesearchaeota archaeon]
MIKKLMKYLIKRSTKLKVDSSKLILFDVDQTLIKVFSFHEKALEKTFKENFSVKASYFDVDFEGRRFADVIKEIGKKHNLDLSEEEILKFINDYSQNFEEILPGNIEKYILPGAKELVQELSKKHTLGIITGSTEKVGSEILKRSKLYDYFKVFCFSNEAKNRAEMVAKAIKKAQNYDFSEAIVIGDSTNDITSAQANHLRVISVNTGHHTKEKLLKHHPDLFVKTLEDKKILEFLK